VAREQYVVYVIDDDKSVRTAFSRLLRSADLRTESFSTAAEFLRASKQETNACVLMDIRMPDASGFDLQRELTASGVTLPVIIVSASDDSSVREHARELGAVAFFRKPVDDQALLDAIWWTISRANSGSREKK
jgi:FixJ family two-component response regulator